MNYRNEHYHVINSWKWLRVIIDFRVNVKQKLNWDICANETPYRFTAILKYFWDVRSQKFENSNLSNPITSSWAEFDSQYFRHDFFLSPDWLNESDRGVLYDLWLWFFNLSKSTGRYENFSRNKSLCFISVGLYFHYFDELRKKL